MLAWTLPAPVVWHCKHRWPSCNDGWTTSKPSCASAADLLHDLESAGADVPANAEAWDRLLRHVRDTLNGEGPALQSA